MNVLPGRAAGVRAGGPLRVLLAGARLALSVGAAGRGPWSAHIAAGSGSPVGTAVHSPIVPVMAHEKQAPAQAVAQQTPCAHWPDLHSVAAEQNAPFGLRPHELWTQTFPASRRRRCRRRVKQRAPLQTYGAQPMASGARQLPFASQVDTGV